MLTRGTQNAVVQAERGIGQTGKGTEGEKVVSSLEVPSKDSEETSGICTCPNFPITQYRFLKLSCMTLLGRCFNVIFLCFQVTSLNAFHLGMNIAAHAKQNMDMAYEAMLNIFEAAATPPPLDKSKVNNSLPLVLFYQFMSALREN